MDSRPYFREIIKRGRLDLPPVATPNLSPPFLDPSLCALCGTSPVDGPTREREPLVILHVRIADPIRGIRLRLVCCATPSPWGSSSPRSIALLDQPTLSGAIWVLLRRWSSAAVTFLQQRARVYIHRPVGIGNLCAGGGMNTRVGELRVDLGFGMRRVVSRRRTWLGGLRARKRLENSGDACRTRRAYARGQSPPPLRGKYCK